MICLLHFQFSPARHRPAPRDSGEAGGDETENTQSHTENKKTQLQKVSNSLSCHIRDLM